MDEEQYFKMWGTVRQALDLLKTLKFYLKLNREISDKLEKITAESIELSSNVQSEYYQGTIAIVQEYFDQLTEIPHQCHQIMTTVRSSIEQTANNYCDNSETLQRFIMEKIETTEDGETNLWTEKIGLLIVEMSEQAAKLLSELRTVLETEVVKVEKLSEDWNTLKKYYDGVFRESNMFQMKKDILECFAIGFREFRRDEN